MSVTEKLEGHNGPKAKKGGAEAPPSLIYNQAVLVA
jgi:hypothetical protein